MKKYLLTLFFILSSQGLCQGYGELKIPDIPFPKEIADTMSGDCHLSFKVDSRGEIISCKISNITQLKKNKRGEVDHKVIYNDSYPELNTPLGLSLENKLQKWLKLFCSKTKYIKAKDADFSWLKEGGYCFTMGHMVYFGKLWKKSSNQNYNLRPK